ncbi:GFA family protein [uncultured Sphingomonas sp.]|uniref:GFA family protein n=1 Tax=uncultured Sphingomonas sp. TaxID=158754 RepID=UPI0035CA08B1
MIFSEGECRCREVRFKVDGGPMMTMACHCTGCQRMTASAFSLSSLYPSDALAITAGEPVIGGSRGATRHYFCPRCMSWLFTRPEGMDDFVNVRSTLLDNARSYRPFMETYTGEKLAWAATGAMRSFDTLPAPDSFPTLLAEFKQAT